MSLTINVLPLEIRLSFHQKRKRNRPKRQSKNPIGLKRKNIKYVEVYILIQFWMWRRSSREAYACRFTFDPPKWIGFKISLLILFEQSKVDQKQNFEQFKITWLINPYSWIFEEKSTNRFLTALLLSIFGPNFVILFFQILFRTFQVKTIQLLDLPN